MKISKHLHSCLFVEDNNKSVIIDPGIFTYEEKVLAIDSLAHLDYILITHEHPDHMHVPLVKDLLKKFPEAKVVSNPSIAAILNKEQIPVHTDLSVLPSDAGIQFEELPHESLWDREVPQNVLFTVFGRLTHPGDSHHFDTTTDILALPIQAPWGSTKEAVDLALRLKPKVIIPIHDWMWKDNFRIVMYQRLEKFFDQHNITFLPLETGAIFDL
jgi:L-ascorbate metabolism protein UlaG (beta-lactamase superfamily)